MIKKWKEQKQEEAVKSLASNMPFLLDMIKCQTRKDHAGDLNIMLQINSNIFCNLLCKTAVSQVKSP